MKYLIALFLMAPSVQAMVLVKCNATDIGTLWASYGHLITSDSDKIATFPTEITYFDKDNIPSRQVYNDYKEALKIPTEVTDARIRLEFDTLTNGVFKHHVIRLLRVHTNDPNSFAGHWSVSAPSQSDLGGLAYCTVY